MVRREGPQRTAEVRWIFAGEIPPAVLGWLKGSELSPYHKPLQALLDRYVWTGRDDVAIKLRGGALEHKTRIDAELLSRSGVKGLLEGWQRRSRPRAPDDDRRPSVGVYKRRRSAWFAAQGQDVLAVPPAPHGSSICTVEVAAIDSAASASRRPSWTLGLKASDGDSALVERVLDLVLRSFPERALLVASRSMSYPAWLLDGARVNEEERAAWHRITHP